MSERFTLLRIDCDREDDDPKIGEIRERYQAGGLPAVRVVSPKGDILARLDDANITPQGFVKLLARAVRCDEPAVQRGRSPRLQMPDQQFSFDRRYHALHCQGCPSKKGCAAARVVPRVFNRALWETCLRPSPT